MKEEGKEERQRGRLNSARGRVLSDCSYLGKHCNNQNILYLVGGSNPPLKNKNLFRSLRQNQCLIWTSVRIQMLAKYNFLSGRCCLSLGKTLGEMSMNVLVKRG